MTSLISETQFTERTTKVSFTEPLVSNVWEISYYNHFEKHDLFYSISDIRRYVLKNNAD